MKKKKLLDLLDEANGKAINSTAYQLKREFQERKTPGAQELESDDATWADLQQAAVYLVQKSMKQNNPHFEQLIEMLTWALGLKPKKKGRSNPGKPRQRADAIFHEALWSYRKGSQMSVRQLAQEVGVSRATVMKWREDPSYREHVWEIMMEDGKESVKDLWWSLIPD